MIKKTIVVMLFILSGFICFNLCSFAQTTEQLDITTYYPSPTGVYQQLRLFPTNVAPACNANNEGALYYNTSKTLFVCDGTSWQKTYPADIPSKTPAGWLPIVTNLTDPLVNPGTTCNFSGYVVCPDAGRMCEDTETPPGKYPNFQWCTAHPVDSWKCSTTSGHCVADAPGRVHCCTP